MTTYCIYDGLSLLDIIVEHHSKNSVSFNIGMATYFSISVYQLRQRILCHRFQQDILLHVITQNL